MLEVVHNCGQEYGENFQIGETMLEIGRPQEIVYRLNGVAGMCAVVVGYGRTIAVVDFDQKFDKFFRWNIEFGRNLVEFE